MFDKHPLQSDQTWGYEGHRAFAVQQLREYPNIWDNEKVLRDPSTFYHRIFEDHQEKKRTTRAACREYEKGNYKVTHSSGAARVTYETDAKNRIQKQLRDALDHIFSLFEMMYAYGDHHLVHTISEEYLLPAIRNTEHIFVSSRCRTCHRGTSYDTTPRHRHDVFMDRLLSMTTIQQDSLHEG